MCPCEVMMGELRFEAEHGGLYERLLQRLAQALEGAEGCRLLAGGVSRELELSGLTPSEVQLIQAYMDHDLNWLRGWHAAAEELALIERRADPQPAFRPLPEAADETARRLSPARAPLYCALCYAPANWQPDQGVKACPSCGSRLFRADNPR